MTLRLPVYGEGVEHDLRRGVQALAHRYGGDEQQQYRRHRHDRRGRLPAQQHGDQRKNRAVGGGHHDGAHRAEQDGACVCRQPADEGDAHQGAGEHIGGVEGQGRGEAGEEVGQIDGYPAMAKDHLVADRPVAVLRAKKEGDENG